MGISSSTTPENPLQGLRRDLVSRWHVHVVQMIVQSWSITVCSCIVHQSGRDVERHKVGLDRLGRGRASERRLPLIRVASMIEHQSLPLPSRNLPRRYAFTYRDVCVYVLHPPFPIPTYLKQKCAKTPSGRGRGRGEKGGILKFNIFTPKILWVRTAPRRRHASHTQCEQNTQPRISSYLTVPLDYCSGGAQGGGAISTFFAATFHHPHAFIYNCVRRWGIGPGIPGPDSALRIYDSGKSEHKHDSLVSLAALPDGSPL